MKRPRSALVLLALAGCLGGVNHADRTVREGASGREASYRFGQPGPEWRPLAHQEAQIAWYNPELSAVIALDSECEEHSDLSLEQFTQRLSIDFREWGVESQEQLQLLDRDALHTVVRASIDGVVETRLEIYVVKKNGCIFDLEYIAPPHQFAAGRPAFARVIAGLEFPL